MRKIFQSTLLKLSFQPRLLSQTPIYCISHLKKDQNKKDQANQAKPTATAQPQKQQQQKSQQPEQPLQQSKKPQQQNTEQSPINQSSPQTPKSVQPTPASPQQQQQQQLSPEEKAKLVLQQKKQQNQEQLQKEIIELEKKRESEAIAMHNQHRSLQKEVDNTLNMPFRLYGWLATPPTKTAYMGERVFAQHRLPKHMILNHLYKIFSGSLYSLANHPDPDTEFLSEYCEKTFSDSLVQRIKDLKSKGYSFKVEEDVTGIRGEPIEKFSYVVDMVMVRGLSVNRDENASLKEYHKWVDIEDMGLVVYTPQSVQNPANFIDPKQNKNVYDSYRKVLMRMLVHIKSPLRLKVFKPDGQEWKVDPNMYTWEHLALFETQMKPPESFKSFYKLENYMEWLGKFEFGVWKMADLDNWMLGNPLFLKDGERDLYRDKIFKGSKFDPEEHIDIRRV